MTDQLKRDRVTQLAQAGLDAIAEEADVLDAPGREIIDASLTLALWAIQGAVSMGADSDMLRSALNPMLEACYGISPSNRTVH